MGIRRGHFNRVYADIIAPACEAANFKPYRADDSKGSNLIQLEILQKLLDAPMAVCDLSTANPNVLFELALRQAFDKPVALIQEVGSRPIFDIASLRYTEYRRERLYDEVLQDQIVISNAIRATFEDSNSPENINSIVRLLGLIKPSIPVPSEDAKERELPQLLLAELKQIKEQFRAMQGLTSSPPLDLHDLRADASELETIAEWIRGLEKISTINMRSEQLFSTLVQSRKSY